MSTIVANVQPVALQADNVMPCNPDYHNPSAIYITDIEAVPIPEEPRPIIANPLLQNENIVEPSFLCKKIISLVGALLIFFVFGYIFISQIH